MKAAIKDGQLDKIRSLSHKEKLIYDEISLVVMMLLFIVL